MCVLPQQTRKLGEEITESGVKLSSLLEHEDEYKDEREKALRFLDATRENYTASGSEMDYVKRSIAHLICSRSPSLSPPAW